MLLPWKTHEQVSLKEGCPMNESPEKSALVQFCRVWADSFVHVLGLLGVTSPAGEPGEPVPAKALSAEEIERTVSVYFQGGGILKGEQIWVADVPAALQLAQLLMAEPPDPAVPFSDTHREAFSELLRQVAGQAATAWQATSGAETQITFHEATGEVFVPAKSATVRITGEKFSELSLRLFVNSPLCDALAVPLPVVPVATAEIPEPPPPASGIALPQNLELLLDVELEATIRFGEKEMLLRDVLGLIPGAIVELDQLVSEPAELLVAGRHIARGEVVVVDGNFGLRVTEVVSRVQRAELLQA
jgi:flagellar motor switch protein FliN